MNPVMTDYLFGAIPGALNTAYNLYTNKRDFDYQKALQQQIFQREDTAVQRRMADLQAAGLNPNLAAGSAASAGSVVSRSSTNDVNMGSALDTLAAVNQLKLQKLEQENKKAENSYLEAQASNAWNQNALINLDIVSKLGNDTSIQPIIDDDGYLRWSFTYDGKQKFYKDTPFYKNYISTVEQNQNANEYLSRELNWFTADKWLNVGKTLGGFIPIPKFNFSTTSRR